MQIPTTATLVAAMKREILVDILESKVPDTVSTFSELHDYVDANMYGDWDHYSVGTPEWDRLTDALSKAQNEVDKWLRDGRMLDEVAPIVAAMTPAQVKATADGTAPRLSKHDSHNAAAWNYAVDRENGYDS